MKLNKDDRSFCFKTSDLPLAVTLVNLGFKLLGVDSQNPSRVIFLFRTSSNLTKSLNDFWQGRISVEPKSFWSTQRELKSRIRNQV